MKLHSHKLILIVILLIQVSCLLYFGSLKKGMHFDECFSYFNTNNSCGCQAYDRTFVSSDDIMKDFYVKKGEGFNYPFVVQLQSYDVHPPLFYLALHTLCSFMPGTFTLWQGLALNIFYAVITSIFIYLSVSRYLDNKYIALVLCFLCAINTGTVCNVLYIRMYCLMTLFIWISIYLHIRMSEFEEFNKLEWKYVILNGALAFLGFMTHYFYLVFLFFIEAFFWLPKLFSWKKNYKGIIKYGIGILSGGILGVLFYPACLGQVNSGYRGQEVKSYLFDLSDFKGRLRFFGGLMNEYVYQKWIYLFLMIFVLLFLLSYYRLRKDNKLFNNGGVYFQCFLIPFLGYFLISAKCSLVGDQTMIRYQLPIYSLGIVTIGIGIYACLKESFRSLRLKIITGVLITLLFLGFNISGIINKNVFYLYTEQEHMENVAEEYSQYPCVYIYHNEDNKYFLWNDALQLAKYEDVYFVNSNNEEKIDEVKINSASPVVVYVSILGSEKEDEEYLDLIFNSNSNVATSQKLYDAMNARCYLVK